MSLHRGLRGRGHETWLAVGRRRTTEDGVLPIAQGRGPWSSLWWGAVRRLEEAGRFRAARLARLPAVPGAAVDLARGHEDFRYPGTAGLLDLPPQPPDVL